jgi:hypothetical protein
VGYGSEGRVGEVVEDEYWKVLQNKVQAMTLSGDALATALAAYLGHEHPLIRMWEESKNT